LTLKYPSILLDVLAGTDVRVRIHELRTAEWVTLKRIYEDNPKKILGFQIYLNPLDFSPVSTSIATSGWLNLSLTALMKKILKPGMTIVDVGANIGYFTLLAAKIVEHGHVYAFEPEQTNFELLTKSVSANDLRNVDMYQKALCDKEGQIKLYLSDPAQPQSHSITFQDGKMSINVASTSLDSFWKSLGRPKIDFLKIHVGGAEATVLMGATEVLQEAKPTIVTMFVPDNQANERILWDRLLSLYDLYELVNSPFLVKPIKPASIFKLGTIELLLTPKS
jgi:FkbM family methyltransferase